MTTMLKTMPGYSIPVIGMRFGELAQATEKAFSLTH
jgi:hypothetical protein